jgi:hypothetical protein
LRHLIKKYELLSYSYSDSNNKERIDAIASHLYRYVDRTGFEEGHWATFWQKVKFKKHCIGREALHIGNVKSGEVSGRSSAADQPVRLRSCPPVKVWKTKSQPNAATRPLHQKVRSHTLTGSIASDREQALGIWSAVDDRVQLQIFQDLIQSAKDPKALIHAMSKSCADEYTKNPGEFDFKFHLALSQQAAGIVPPQFASACKACGLPQMRTPLQSVKVQVSC